MTSTAPLAAADTALPVVEDLTHSNSNSDTETIQPSTMKKKKKRKPKKSAAAKAQALLDTERPASEGDKKGGNAANKSPVLCISRNKHWRYISSYHGPWLQLPLELLDSLLVLNLDPATLSPPPPSATTMNGHMSMSMSMNVGMNIGNSTYPNSSYGYGNPYIHSSMGLGHGTHSASGGKQRDRMPQNANSTYPYPYAYPTHPPDKPTPPPIDPGVFRCVTQIRRLIDEAAELAVRAASGGDPSSTAPLFNSSFMGNSSMGMNNFMGMGMNAGFNMNGGFGNFSNAMANNPHPSHSGRLPTLSPTRIHRLRVLAVQKLAAAYRADEIASSVMVMQGGSVFDDLAERVLRFDPNDPDARYVHFFHEKIPSRQLAQSTTTAPLDTLISQHPHVLEYYRTRGIVHCFRDEYKEAVKDFGGALREARASRKRAAMEAGVVHINGNSDERDDNLKGKKNTASKKKKKKPTTSLTVDPNEDDSPDASESADDQNQNGHTQAHPSTLPNAPGPLEPQLLFLRGAAYLQWAVWEIERGVLGLEGVIPPSSSPHSHANSDANGKFFVDGAELRLSQLENGRYGGTEIGTEGPLGKRDGDKARAYRAFFGFDSHSNSKTVNAKNAKKEKSDKGDKDKGEKTEALKDTIIALLKKSIRDHEKFLAHFDTLEATLPERSVTSAFPFGGDGGVKNGKGIDIDGGTGVVNGVDTVGPNPKGTLAQRTEYAFLLSESIRPGSHHSMSIPLSSFSPTSSGTVTPSSTSSSASPLPSPHEPIHFPHPTLFTTYHPLLVESHFSILLAQLMLGDFVGLLPAFARTAEIVDALEGYPVFLPPRSMAQAEFVEVLERLAGGWDGGKSKETEHESNADKKKDTNGPPLSSSASSSSATSSSSSSFSSASGSSTSSSSVQQEPTATPKKSKPKPTSPLLESLHCARILLAPVAARQKLRAERAAYEKAERARERRAAKNSKPSATPSMSSTPTSPTNTTNSLLTTLANTVGVSVPSSTAPPKKSSSSSTPINIPLHGPRVEVVLAWLGAGCLIELEEAEERDASE